jgi:MFS family permease
VEQRSRIWSVLRHRDFRLLWVGQSLSVVGDGIVNVALALFVIKLTGSATDLGVVLAAKSVSLIAFLLVGGVWADRVPRHRLIFVTDVTRVALHGALAVLIFAGSAAIWSIVAIEIAYGAAEAFSRPAASGLLPQTVPEAEIQEANALLSVSSNLAEFVGPALATALVLGVGAGTAFAADALTFAVSAVLVARIRPRRRASAELEAQAEAVPGRGAMWREIREGFDEVRSRAWVWVTLLVFSVTLFVAFAPWEVLGPVVARDQYGDLAVYGIVAAALGVGTVAGSIVGIRWRPARPMRLGMIFALAWPPGFVLYALGATEWLVLPAVALAGAGLALFEIWWLTALARHIPPDRLSRVTSYDWMLSFSLLPIGFLIAGPLANAIGTQTVLLGGSILGFAILSLGLLPRETRELGSA